MPRSFRLSLAFLLFAVASRAGAQGSLIILNKGEATASIVSLSGAAGPIVTRGIG